MDRFIVFYASISCDGGRYNDGTTGVQSFSEIEYATEYMLDRAEEFKRRPWTARVVAKIVRASDGEIIGQINWARGIDEEAA